MAMRKPTHHNAWGRPLWLVLSRRTRYAPETVPADRRATRKVRERVARPNESDAEGTQEKAARMCK